MDLLYTDHDLTLQKLMDSISEMEYIAKERNLVLSMKNEICTGLKDDIYDSASYKSAILVSENSVDYFKNLGYNLFEQFESETVYEYFLRPISKKSDKKAKGTGEFAIVTTLDYSAEDILNSDIPPGTRTRPSVLMDAPAIVQHLDDALPETGRNSFDNPSFQLEEFFDSAVTPINDPNVQSIKITTDVHIKGAAGKPPLDLALVWSRKYCSSNRHVAFKLDYPQLYKREYDRIRQSPLKVLDALISRQRSGFLSQRKVLEVIARPHYNIYPPTDVEEIVRFNRHGFNMEGHQFLSLSSSCTFDCYPLSKKVKKEWLANGYYLRDERISRKSLDS